MVVGMYVWILPSSLVISETVKKFCSEELIFLIPLIILNKAIVHGFCRIIKVNQNGEESISIEGKFEGKIK